MMKTVHVFGNEYVKGDAFSHEVARHLHEVRIVECRSPDDLLDAEGEMIILDVVKGIHEPVLIKNIAQLKTRKLISLHDFDVGFFLNLMKELGMESEIKIIGIPESGDAKKIADKVKLWI
jgi:Ni,Fe-hydrogenase maturation factor